MDKAAFSIIHVNRNKRETGLPFIAEPAGSDDCLRDLFVSEKIHQDKKDKTTPVEKIAEVLQVDKDVIVKWIEDK